MNLAGHDESYLHTVWAFASVIGVIVIIAFAVIYRRARRAAETEEVERILREHDASQPRSPARKDHASARHLP
ncbi:MAG: hypothetical protein QM831_10030 [Kofleriaceae bacterium]